jgi:hypothetical protein
VVVGTSSQWADLIDPLVPLILNLVVTSWRQMPPLASDDKEDKITEALCRILRQNRTARELPFRIDFQYVELEPSNDEGLGRLDIAFSPPVNREDIYFCLECKRLNVISGGPTRSYAAEYVTFGMMRFVRGQYAQAVRHGGMAAYVLDGNITTAIQNVATNLQNHHVALGMSPPGAFSPSSILVDDGRARETHHQRPHQTGRFCIHHLFMAREAATKYGEREVSF